MLSSLELKGYRGFAQFQLTGLSRVNLLVGRNNCGKTSILEAVELLASGGNLGVLSAIAGRRGEVSSVAETPEPHRRESTAVLAHFFHGHELGPNASFTVNSGDGLGRITVRIATLAELREKLPETLRQIRLFEEYQEEEFRASLAVCVESTGNARVSDFPPVPITEDGAIPTRLLPRLLHARYRGVVRREPHRAEPVQFISPDSLDPRSMTEMWNTVITEGRESEVIRAMQILEPSLEGVFFLSGEAPYQYGGGAGILAAFSGIRRRDPLGSHGDGMRRLLALSLALIQSRGSVLLVDEIDTGLHYSIMGDMWRLVVEAARQSDVQVLATTHSLDCVKGLAWLCENYPELGTDVSVQKIHPGLDEAVALNAAAIVLADHQNLEVR
ncbi:MAG: hypothetical protein A2V70_03170 [Planctomycetes bacterium RBG_13_63_9]|nr:MAG: hypothetical protein A2V70_03170 [Planctomycetes bacterium RBG_13_63_9]